MITIVGTLGERNVKVKRRNLSKLSFAQINASELHLAATPPTAPPQPSTAAELSVRKALAMVSAFAPATVPPNKGPHSDELLASADILLQALRKVDAAFKVSASADLLTSALMDAQMRLDEIQGRTDKDQLQRTIESAAFALHGFLEARASNSSQTLQSAREALETAAQRLASFKSTGREPDTVKPPVQTPLPGTSTPEATVKSKHQKYPSTITIK